MSLDFRNWPLIAESYDQHRFLVVHRSAADQHTSNGFVRLVAGEIECCP
jgi:hypothetical protein